MSSKLTDARYLLLSRRPYIRSDKEPREWKHLCTFECLYSASREFAEVSDFGPSGREHALVAWSVERGVSIMSMVDEDGKVCPALISATINIGMGSIARCVADHIPWIFADQSTFAPTETPNEENVS